MDEDIEDIARLDIARQDACALQFDSFLVSILPACLQTIPEQWAEAICVEER